MAKIKGRFKPSIKRTPTKAGRAMPKNVGGIVNVKTLAIAKLVKKKRK